MKFRSNIVLSMILIFLSGCFGMTEHFAFMANADLNNGVTIKVAQGIPSLVRGNSVQLLQFGVSANLGLSVQAVLIQYSTDGTNFTTISRLSGGAQNFPWTVPPVDVRQASLRISATDNLGNISTLTLPPFRIFFSPPVLSLDSGESALVTNSNSVTLSGNCESDYAVSASVTYNGATNDPESFRCEGGRWSMRTNGTNDGQYLYSISETDSVGNTSQLVATWIRNTQSPNIKITSSANLITNNTNQSFGGTCKTGLGIQIAVSKNGASPQIVNTISCQSDGTWSFPLSAAKAGTDGNYSFTFSQTDPQGNTGTSSANWMLDTVAPTIKLYLGTVVPVSNACATTPQIQNPIALRQVPYDFCATDNLGGSGTLSFCMKPLSAAAPSATDSCWSPVSSTSKYAVLNDGLNTMVAYVKDAAGNIGSDQGSITLNIGTPPLVSIIAPTSSYLASSVWHAGDSQSLTFYSTDKNGNTITGVRYVIALSNATDVNDYYLLGCNFSDSVGSDYRVCPNPAYQNSAGFSGPDKNGVMTFNFTVPAGWDPTKKYIAQILAVDSAGNGAVVSTQEINAPWEVLAGRTYSGIGGSGVTIGVQSTFRNQLTANTKGEVLQTVDYYKLNAFDHRSCRFLRSPGTTSPFDCADVVEATDTLSPKGWVYNKTRDVFYAIGIDGVSIFKLNFNSLPKPSLTKVFGGGSTALTSSLSSAALASNYKTAGSTSTLGYLFYSTPLQKLFFNYGGAIYSIDETGSLLYVMGNSSPVSIPVDQNSVAQSSLTLPNTNFPFAVTADGRILFVGPTRLSGLAGHDKVDFYLVSGLNPNAPTTIASLNFLYSQTISNQIDYDEAGKRFFVNCNQDLCQINAPSASAPLVAGNYPYQTSISGFGGAKMFAYAGGDLMYVLNSTTGYVNSLNLTKPLSASNPETLIGFPTGTEGGQYAQNRRLFYPRSIFLDPNGKVVFNDSFNLQRIDLGTQTTPATITTLITQFPVQNMKYDSLSGNIFSSVLNKLVTQQYFSISNGSYADLTLPSTTQTQPAIQAQYETGYGFGNLGHKTAYFGGAADPTVFTKQHSAGQLFDFDSHSDTILSAPPPNDFGFGTAFCGSGSQTCQQGTPQVQSNGSVTVPFSQFLVAPSNGATVLGHFSTATVAFDGTDSNLFVCVGNQFFLLNLASQKAFPFNPINQSGTALTQIHCADSVSLFSYSQGKIYWAYSGSRFNGAGNFYSIDPTNIMVNNTAVFVQENASATPAALYGNQTYAGMDLDSSYIYYTEQTSHRVLRSPRISH